MRRHRSRLSWIGSAAVPWTAALGLLVSFTAAAGTDHVFDARPSPAVSRFAGTTPKFLRDGVALAHAGGDAAEALASSAAAWATGADGDGLIAVPDLGVSLAPGSAGDTPDGRNVGMGALETSDGATPAVPKAVALSSVTPAPADAVPVEVAASSLALPGFSLRSDQMGGSAVAPPDPSDATQNRYADLIQSDAMDREQRCLAEAVYFEARSESEEGQAAVAQVVLNRVKSGLYPKNVCGVVYQNRHRYMGCQFSFACEGKSLRVTDAAAWQSATRIADAVIEGKTYLSEVGGATHYHANYVRPGWSRRLKRMDVIGRHIFYSLKRGQT